MAILARIFLLVLALRASLCLAKVKVHTVYVDLDDYVDLKNIHQTKNDVISCKLVTNNATEFVLYPIPNGGNRPSENKKFSFDKYSEFCTVRVNKMTQTDSGIWKINTAIKTPEGTMENVVFYNIQVRKIDKSLKSQTINVYQDQQVSLGFQDRFSDLLACKLLSPELLEYSLEPDNLSKISKVGKCGVKMDVKPKNTGRWTLIADSKNNTATIKSFDIIVKDEKNLVLNRTSFSFKRGRKAILTVGRFMDLRICMFEDPYGKSYPIIESTRSRECELEIPNVKEHHAGLWKVFYGLEGYQSLVPQEIELKVNREITFNSSVVHRKNGDINLLCQVRGLNMRFCSFVRPDGKVLHMTYGIGDKKYEYYGNSLNIEDSMFSHIEDYDCGITIHRPSSEDYGSWKCLFKFSEPSVTNGRILKVTQPVDSNPATNTSITTKNVYVKKGDSFEVKCTSQELLRYCWLRSPNGTLYSVSTESSTSKNVLKYKGAGLELGECGAEIKVANTNHSGQWTCNLGVNGSIEIRESFNVTVKDTRLMAAQDVITVSSEGGVDLICQPLPESDQLIDTCRWVNPLGYGINIDDSEHYGTETKATHCKLSIRAHDKNDIGKWYCYARFVNAPEEERDEVIVMASQHLSFSKANLSLILGIILCISLASVLLVLQRLKFRSKPDDEDVILEKPNTFA
ncbi:uncharacterized protein LOC106639433 [Copidosoma floridanum]|uniref:uncharacterized protein LOC106639433 n=1 Tax=Copidosoma floridanum TaxID=29053 RepID=UPI0006C9607A|nr:uncharacterized protein LOC106639433 [Copidosoma floridanum]